ncbi:hypothetical protein DV532_16460 [Pseudomonas sp. Leaf58]|uniref:hypothetical protein n=1 Tax=Pseudomonas sp. Leaf58 TaxID=1736226 RepID=UPI0006FE75FE|nr:hypothetical protein [Pseudomonas sp. Leaf58]AYG45793.1 hypothetical protein DV532_16460 [Pseudomonas sp. Leaf58]KQN58998.1 hypothetical protein ASF02_19200 [Pseudomonas sp. Leaf58]
MIALTSAEFDSGGFEIRQGRDHCGFWVMDGENNVSGGGKGTLEIEKYQSDKNVSGTFEFTFEAENKSYHVKGSFNMTKP